MNVLITPQHWGLGHITRSIPVIRYYIDRGHNVYLASSGAGIDLLTKEFPSIECIRLVDYGVKYPSKNMIINMFFYLIHIHKAIVQEYFQIRKICKQKNIELIISDARLGAFHHSIPCAIISHHLHIPVGNFFFEWISDTWMRFFYMRFDELWVPDIDGPGNISGILAQNFKSKHKYFIGAISRFEKISLEKKYDLCIILSGPEPQRTILETKLVAQLRDFSDKKIILVRGISDHLLSPYPNLEILPLAASTTLNHIICESDFVICRSGYTSLLDLYKLSKKALLIPTPGQPEQIYLAEELMRKNMFYQVSQDDLNLNTDLNIAYQYGGYFSPSEKNSLGAILDERTRQITSKFKI